MSDWQDKLRVLKEWAQDKWLDFRAQSGFFQIKVAVVLGYVVLIVLPTIALVPPAPVTFDVKIHKASFGLTYRTVVEVRNLKLGDLRKVDVVVTGSGLDFDKRERAGEFKGTVAILPEGQKVQLGPDKLLDSEGRAAPGTLNVSRVRLFEDGDLVFDHVPGMPPR